MTDDKRYKRIQDLMRALADAGRELEKGALGRDGLEQACDDARELFERLVVLRHKAREGERPHPPAASLALAAEPPPAPSQRKEPPPTPVIRLDTRPEIRQTSLIDAIAETETPAEKARKEKAAGRPKSVADRLGQAPIPDLGKAVTLSQKFLFTAEMFGGDRSAFDLAVEAINAAPGLAEARRLVDQQLARLKKAPDPEALQNFMGLIERRFS